MQIQLSLHVFGSLKGYTTLAKTPDVTSAESVFLERFSFGQTTDQSYLNSLDTNPAFISRPLPSGRWAVTRVMKGQPDDYNRQTMLFTTAILTITDWLDILHCNFMPLLQELRLRSFSPGDQLSKVVIDVPAQRPTPPAELREKVIPLLSAIETTDPSSRSVLLLNDASYNADVLCWLNMILPHQNRTTFSCAGRVLSDGLDVDVISMAQAASFGNSTRKPIQFSPASLTDKSSFTLMIDRYWQERGMPPWQFIDKCQSFTFDQNLSDFSTPTQVISRPPRGPVVAKTTRPHVAFSSIIKVILFLLIIAIFATTGYFVKTRIKTAQTVNTLLVDYNDFISKNSNLFVVTQRLDDLTADCRQLINRIDILNASANDPCLVNAKKELETWLNKASERQNVNKTIKDFLDDCGNVKLHPLPSVYPSRKEDIEHILRLKQQCISYLVKNADLFEENYKERLNAFMIEAGKWLKDIEEPLNKLRKSYEDIPKDILAKPPSAYKQSEIDGYNKMRDDLKKLKNDESLKNALSSPIEEHRNDANNLNTNIDKQITVISEKIQIAEDFKKQSSVMIDEVKKYLTDANNVGADLNCIQKLYEKNKNIEDAKNLWPANPEIYEVAKKLSSAINISEAEKYLADTNSVSTDPNYVQKLAKIGADVKDAKRDWPTKVEEVDKKLLEAKKFSNQMETINKKFSEIEKHLADPNCERILFEAYTKINEMKEPYLLDKTKNRFIELFKNWQKKMQDIGDNVVYKIYNYDPNKPFDPNDDKQSYEDVGKILKWLDNLRKDNKENVQTNRDTNSTSTN